VLVDEDAPDLGLEAGLVRRDRFGSDRAPDQRLQHPGRRADRERLDDLSRGQVRPPERDDRSSVALEDDRERIEQRAVQVEDDGTDASIPLDADRGCRCFHRSGHFSRVPRRERSCPP
jgi:hypothetical protein